MNDQMILLILSFVAAIIAVMTPIIKLNTSITKLNTTLDGFQKQTEANHKNLADRVTAHGKELDKIKETVIDGTRRIDYIEERCSNCPNSPLQGR